MHMKIDLLSQKLTRREFLIQAGLFILVATGISGMLKRFSSLGSKGGNKSSGGGYGN